MQHITEHDASLHQDSSIAHRCESLTPDLSSNKFSTIGDKNGASSSCPPKSLDATTPDQLTPTPSHLHGNHRRMADGKSSLVSPVLLASVEGGNSRSGKEADFDNALGFATAPLQDNGLGPSDLMACNPTKFLVSASALIPMSPQQAEHPGIRRNQSHPVILDRRLISPSNPGDIVSTTPVCRRAYSTRPYSSIGVPSVPPERRKKEKASDSLSNPTLLPAVARWPNLERCKGLIVLAKRGDSYKQARFVKVRPDGQGGVLFEEDKEKAVNYFVEPEKTDHIIADFPVPKESSLSTDTKVICRFSPESFTYKVAFVKSYNEETGKFTVRMDDGGREVSVPRERVRQMIPPWMFLNLSPPPLRKECDTDWVYDNNDETTDTASESDSENMSNNNKNDIVEHARSRRKACRNPNGEVRHHMSKSFFDCSGDDSVHDFSRCQNISSNINTPRPDKFSRGGNWSGTNAVISPWGCAPRPASTLSECSENLYSSHSATADLLKYEKNEIVTMLNGVRRKYNGKQWRKLCQHGDCMKESQKQGLCSRHQSLRSRTVSSTPCKELVQDRTIGCGRAASVALLSESPVQSYDFIHHGSGSSLYGVCSPTNTQNISWRHIPTSEASKRKSIATDEREAVSGLIKLACSPMESQSCAGPSSDQSNDASINPNLLRRGERSLFAPIPRVSMVGTSICGSLAASTGQGHAAVSGTTPTKDQAMEKNRCESVEMASLQLSIRRGSQIQPSFGQCLFKSPSPSKRYGLQSGSGKSGILASQGVCNKSDGAPKNDSTDSGVESIGHTPTPTTPRPHSPSLLVSPFLSSVQSCLSQAVADRCSRLHSRNEHHVISPPTIISNPVASRVQQYYLQEQEGELLGASDSSVTLPPTSRVHAMSRHSSGPINSTRRVTIQPHKSTKIVIPMPQHAVSSCNSGISQHLPLPKTVTLPITVNSGRERPSAFRAGDRRRSENRGTRESGPDNAFTEAASSTRSALSPVTSTARSNNSRSNSPTNKLDERSSALRVPEVQQQGGEELSLSADSRQATHQPYPQGYMRQGRDIFRQGSSPFQQSLLPGVLWYPPGYSGQYFIANSVPQAAMTSTVSAGALTMAAMNPMMPPSIFYHGLPAFGGCAVPPGAAFIAANPGQLPNFLPGGPVLHLPNTEISQPHVIQQEGNTSSLHQRLPHAQTQVVTSSSQKNFPTQTEFSHGSLVFSRSQFVAESTTPRATCHTRANCSPEPKVRHQWHELLPYVSYPSPMLEDPKPSKTNVPTKDLMQLSPTDDRNTEQGQTANQQCMDTCQFAMPDSARSYQVHTDVGSCKPTDNDSLMAPENSSELDCLRCSKSEGDIFLPVRTSVRSARSSRLASKNESSATASDSDIDETFIPNTSVPLKKRPLSTGMMEKGNKRQKKVKAIHLKTRPDFKWRSTDRKKTNNTSPCRVFESSVGLADSNVSKNTPMRSGSFVHQTSLTSSFSSVPGSSSVSPSLDFGLPPLASLTSAPCTGHLQPTAAPSALVNNFAKGFTGLSRLPEVETGTLDSVSFLPERDVEAQLASQRRFLEPTELVGTRSRTPSLECREKALPESDIDISDDEPDGRRNHMQMRLVAARPLVSASVAARRQHSEPIKPATGTGGRAGPLVVTSIGMSSSLFQPSCQVFTSVSPKAGVDTPPSTSARELEVTPPPLPTIALRNIAASVPMGKLTQVKSEFRRHDLPSFIADQDGARCLAVLPTAPAIPPPTQASSESNIVIVPMQSGQISSRNRPIPTMKQDLNGFLVDSVAMNPYLPVGSNLPGLHSAQRQMSIVAENSKISPCTTAVPASCVSVISSLATVTSVVSSPIGSRPLSGVQSALYRQSKIAGR